jgi:hypothetical protein
LGALDDGNGGERGGDFNLVDWGVLALCSALVALGIVWIAPGLSNTLAARPGEIPLDVVRHIDIGLAQLRESEDELGLTRVAYLGDSTVASYPNARRMPVLLEAALGERADLPERVEVVDLAYAGMGHDSFYFLAGRIAEARPDLLLLQLNLRHLSTAWSWSATRKGLSGWTEWSRMWPLLTMSTERIGLTIDRLLLYGSIVHFGGFEAWYHLAIEQSRVAGLRRVLEDRISERTGRKPERRFRRVSGYNYQHRNTFSYAGHARFIAERELENYGPVLTGVASDAFMLRMLGGELDVYRAAGIPFAVYLVPTNVDSLRAVGVMNDAAMRQSVDAFRGVVESRGGRFLDFHAEFPDAWFSDTVGHLVYEDEVDAPAELIEKLLPPVEAELRRLGGR